MADVRAARAPLTVVRYDPSMDAEVYDFQRRAYPHRRPDWIVPRWRWMFVASAARFGLPPAMWLSRDASGIVGHQGRFPIKLKVGADEHDTAWLVETIVLDSHRGQGIGRTLLLAAMEGLPFSLSLGQTEPMRRIQYAVGWQRLAPLETYMYVLNAERVLSDKLSAIPRRAAAVALTARRQLRALAGRPRKAPATEVAHVERFDARHDRLWRDVSEEYTCAGVRDASYLNWKYVEQPGQDFVRLELRSGGVVVSVAIVSVVEPDADYRYRRAFLVDLVVRPSDAGAVWATLDAVRALCLTRDVDLLVFHVINDALQRAVLSYGFLRREPSRVLLIWTEGASDEVRDRLRAPAQWLVTMGDSDIDRPW